MTRYPHSATTLPRRRAAILTVATLVVAALIAYGVLWLGGAYEAVNGDVPPDGPTCVVRVDSWDEVGTEAVDWSDGGMARRPGRVCRYEDLTERHLSWADVTGALLSLAALGAALCAGYLYATRASRYEGPPRTG